MSLFKAGQSEDKIGQLIDYIEQSDHMVAVTGAGISLAGGGITYRRLSKTVRSGGLGSDSFLPSYVKAMHSYKPTFSHYALRDLEAEGKLIGIITTNEDCMHTMAGSKKRCGNTRRFSDKSLFEVWSPL